MYETQYVLLFLAGVLLTTAAWTGRATGFAAGAGIFVWGVIGFGSMALVVRGGAGSEYVYAAPALAWLCFGNAGMHAIRLLIHIQEWMSDADDAAEQLDPTQQLSTGMETPEENL